MAFPNAKMNIDRAGLDFITKWEGLVLHVYRDVAGKKTFGVGHLVTPAEDAKFPEGKIITREFAMETLRKDVRRVVSAVREHSRVKLNQNQFNALVSFGFNVGTGAIEDSGVMRAVNAGNFAAVPGKLMEWRNITVDGVKTENQGLVNRRRSEGELFSTPVGSASTNAASMEVSEEEPAPSSPKSAAKLLAFTVSAIVVGTIAYRTGLLEKIVSPRRAHSRGRLA